jgi:DNA repair exonuclease SbcCD ATPase subunit
MDSPVFGLIGPNASGKSNIMSAIAFGFTGMLDLNQASYVRNSAGEDIANGSVDLYFLKGGVKGRIFRQVGKSPSRKLWWEDWSTPITKAAEIDKLMNQILDCDKKAINQAVFLSQGHLADFLLGTPAQREEDFSRMCLIDHLAAVSDIAAQEIMRLQKTVTDLTSQRDEALLTKEQAENALRTAEGEVELHPDRSKQIVWISSQEGRYKNIHRQKELAQINLAALQQAQERLAAISCPDFTDANTAEALLEELKLKLADCNAAAERLTSAKDRLNLRRQTVSRLQELRAEIAAIAIKAPRLTQLQSELDTFIKQIIDIQEYQTWSSGFEAWKLRKQTCEASIASGESEIAKLEAVAQVEEKDTKAREALNGLLVEEYQLGLAKTAEGHVSGCCPLCRSSDLSQLPTGAELVRLQSEVAGKLRDTRAVLAACDAARSTRSKYQARLDSLKQQLEQILLERPPAREETSIPDVTQLSSVTALRAQREQERSELQAELASVQRVSADMNRLESDLAGLCAEEEYLAIIAECEALVDSKVSHESKIPSLQTYLLNRASNQRAVESAQAQLEQAATELQKLQSEYDEAFKLKPAEILLEAGVTLEELKSASEQFAQRQAERERAQGMVRANTDAMRRAESRVQEIERRVRQNAKTMSVIGHLEELKNAFGRHGIPRHYLTKVFESLVSMTQENLADWDTDFQVEKDEANLFNFQFCRSDDPDTMMDQNQLSGGQRTRLALSFIQAVQRLLYPGLDFLCVDEPSNHLDAEGVEGLVRLFQTIAAQNVNGEAQVIVVDHNPLLHRAFSKSVSLQRLKGEES